MNSVRLAVASALRAGATRQPAFDVEISRRARRSSGTALSALGLTLGLASAAYAQQAPAPAAGGGSLDEVTVTGSRIRRTTDFDTANPTTVIDSSYLRNLGIVNVGDAIKQLPSNVSNNTPATTGNSSFFAGSTIANLRGLNPFFGSRTLNLVNSRRFVPTNQGDGVDLNFIPSILIDRVDVVTGGASAAYGSGAISGVNNIFLNRKLEGGRADIDFGQTSESDGDDKHVGLAYGASLFGDRGHVVFGYEYQDSDPIGCINARDWCRRGTGFYQNPSGASLTLGDDIRSNQMSTTGTFYVSNPAATSTLQATPDGLGVVPHALGQQPQAGTPFSLFNVVPGGDGKSIYEYTNLRAPVKRNVATGTFTFAVTDTVNMSVDLSYGKVETANVTGALDAQATTITAQNAFLTPALDAARIASIGQFPFPGADAVINKDWTSQVNAGSFVTTNVKRAVIGFDGKFGESSWGWDGYYQYGLTNREQLVKDNRHLNAYNYAVDSVLVGGVPTCRILSPGGGFAALSAAQQSIAASCVALNPFGNQPLSAAAKAYAFGALDEDLRYEQQLIALNASGDLFKGFDAGPIQGAIGVEFRTEKGENIAKAPPGTPDASRSDYLIQYGESFAGDVDVTEGYAEVSVPVLKNAAFAKRLDFDFAVRQSQYKNQGKAGTTGQKSTHDLTTWKISGIYDPVDWLRVRGSRSRDARAANFRELYYGQKIGAGGLFGFCEPTGVQPRDACNWSLEGNTDLSPETADTITAGFVFTPSEALPGFQFAADYFRIEINDAIQQASVQGVLGGCNYGLGDQSLCSLITTAVPGVYTDITDLRALASNGSGYMFKGVDFTSSYTMDIGGDDSLAFRLLATRMIDQQFQALPGGPFINVVGQVGTGNSFLADNQPTAKWTANLSATYTHGNLGVTAQGRYVASGIMDYQNGQPPPAGRTLSTNSVPSYEVFSLSGQYTFQDLGVLKSLQLFGVIDNLFDKDPPIAAGGGAFGPSNANGGTNAIFYDTQGRTFRLGVRTTF